jgi:hypothetical protein
VVARAIEAAGVSTVQVSLVREHTAKVKPPRALFVPFPFGHPFGRPDEPELQHRVLRAALDLLTRGDCPVLADFPDEAEPGDEPASPVQASAVTAAASLPDPALETTQMRRFQEQWRQRTGKTAVGITGIPPTKFRGIVRFLEAFADGKEADMAERGQTPLQLWIRRCVDDLKALYYEARLAQKPEASGEELARWFWGETATGRLIVRVKERMEASEDQRIKGAAFGIAR